MQQKNQKRKRIVLPHCLPSFFEDFCSIYFPLSSAPKPPPISPVVKKVGVPDFFSAYHHQVMMKKCVNHFQECLSPSLCVDFFLYIKKEVNILSYLS